MLERIGELKEAMVTHGFNYVTVTDVKLFYKLHGIRLML